MLETNSTFLKPKAAPNCRPGRMITDNTDLSMKWNEGRPLAMTEVLSG